MKKSIALSLTLSLVLLFSASFKTKEKAMFWGANGHRITAQIGELNLDDGAKKKLKEITHHSLAYLATFPDDVRSDSNWNFMTGLHFINVDDWETLEGVLAKTDGTDFPTNVVEGVTFFADLIGGVRHNKVIFQDSINAHGASLHGLSIDEVALAYLVHFVGDLHQPMHAGRAYDRGGNEVAVNYFGSNTNLHSVWDSGIIEFQNLSYSEYANFLNTAPKDSVTTWQKHKVKDWAQESVDLKSKIYPATYSNTSGNPKLPQLSYDYNFAMKPIMDKRLLKGGIRLAGELKKNLKKRK